jgi:hypothetical protein
VELETFFLHGCNSWSVLDKEMVMVLKLVLRGLMLAVGLTVASFSGQHVDAAVVSVTTNPTSVAYDPSATPTINTITLTGSGISTSFQQNNDTVGKDLSANPGLAGWIEVVEGTSITGGLSFNSSLSIGPNVNGDKFYAFKLSDGGQDYFGWVKMNLGGAGGAISYLAAAFQTDSGGPILAGQGPGGGAVPEPATAAIFGLATLVAGARGFNARRKAQAAS